jgi:hypothetical protein
MIAFGKVKQLEKRIKLIEEYIQSQTPPEKVRDNGESI